MLELVNRYVEMLNYDLNNLSNWNYCWPLLYFWYFMVKWYVITLPVWLPVRMVFRVTMFDFKVKNK